MLAEEDLMAVGPGSPLCADAACALVGDACCLCGGAWGSVGFSGLAGGAEGTLCAPEPVAFDCSRPGAPRLAPEGPFVVAIGAFDGLHLGHQGLLRRARKEARARGCRLAVVTFSPDPAEVLSGPLKGEELLSRSELMRRLMLCEPTPDAAAFVGFTPALASLRADEFVRGVVERLFDVSAVVVGADFRLGAGGAGDVAALRALGREDGFDVVGVELLGLCGEPVTATRIRRLVRAGRVEAAAGLLGRCHVCEGTVEHGRGEGASLGFPTANVMVEASSCLPEQGVYACYVVADAGAGPLAWPAAVNVGTPPTFAGEGGAEDARSLLEANLIGFDGDLYGSRARVVFVRWLRDSRPFSSMDELVRTVRGNIDWTTRSLGSRGIEL